MAQKKLCYKIIRHLISYLVINLISFKIDKTFGGILKSVKFWNKIKIYIENLLKTAVPNVNDISMVAYMYVFRQEKKLLQAEVISLP